MASNMLKNNNGTRCQDLEIEKGIKNYNSCMRSCPNQIACHTLLCNILPSARLASNEVMSGIRSSTRGSQKLKSGGPSNKPAFAEATTLPNRSGCSSRRGELVQIRSLKYNMEVFQPKFLFVGIDLLG